MEITDVKIYGDKIYHYSDLPLDVGKRVHGKIDFAPRFRNMQNHSGEHIISGIAHNLFGYENVGFHLGEDNVTMDLNGPLSEDDIERIEALANEIVYKNMPIRAYYPDENELENLEYRAKGEIEEKIRIVEIGDIDKCACCAPHVNFTGQIGIIKITNAIKYKGGMRFNILCGLDAFYDYSDKHKQNKKISSLLSAKEDETFDGVERLIDNINTLNGKLSEKSKQIAGYIIDKVENTDKNICIFIDDCDMGNLRLIANDLKVKTTAFAIILSGNDTDGYKYVIISDNLNAEEFTKNANTSLSGRGGGRGTMTSGTFMATKEEIEKYFN